VFVREHILIFRSSPVPVLMLMRVCRCSGTRQGPLFRYPPPACSVLGLHHHLPAFLEPVPSKMRCFLLSVASSLDRRPRGGCGWRPPGADAAGPSAVRGASGAARQVREQLSFPCLMCSPLIP
jgi:hypothetical protein